MVARERARRFYGGAKAERNEPKRARQAAERSVRGGEALTRAGEVNGAKR